MTHEVQIRTLKNKPFYQINLEICIRCFLSNIAQLKLKSKLNVEAATSRSILSAWVR